MRLSRKHRNHGIGFDITPMIDVVFQLIIFFMTCSQIAAVDQTPIDLPRLPGATDAGQRDLAISVRKDGTLLLQGKPVTIPDIEARVRAAAAERGGADKISVALRVDAAARSALPNGVVRALVAQGVQRGLIAVEAAGPTGE